MALKKTCKCGAIIDYADKYCGECELEVKYTKAERNKTYDKNVRNLRDKKYTEFYHSKQWRHVVERVKKKYNYMDIYSYYINNKIEYGKICHHVRELKMDGWDSRLDTNVIVYVTHDNHTLIHDMLDDDYEGTVKVLLGLIQRYEEEFK